MTDELIIRQHRILVIDDNAAIHNDFRKILAGQPPVNPQLDDVEKALFGAIAQCAIWSSPHSAEHVILSSVC